MMTTRTFYNVAIQVNTYYGDYKTFNNLKDAFQYYKKCLNGDVDTVILTRQTVETTTTKKFFFRTVTTTKVIDSKELLSMEF